MFCQAAREQVYGSRYQWIILGYPSLSTWWNEPTDCSMQEIIRVINGTLQTRVPRLSIDDNENQSEYITEYIKQFSKLEKDYFDGYVYDTIWSLAYLYQSHLLSNQSITGIFKNILENIDFIDATLTCRMMKDKTCRIPCYEEEDDCHLTVVKIFLAKYLE
ncbi:unnamed protein product [Rotaria sordida]|uniref:Receptor ligand binding region domain-containing protein n=1 Tax=Rotaria sordida TaxID=392033 RepID=A0A820A995_9BILA|nr:unnamed protein product [Rotaria sordida]CAF1395594.1 unnamed protein product [Rotaria sordida]CAF4185853.1 unnamed protein product [Rotaria sordida]